jgi:hypothetical protein
MKNQYRKIGTDKIFIIAFVVFENIRKCKKIIANPRYPVVEKVVIILAIIRMFAMVNNFLPLIIFKINARVRKTAHPPGSQVGPGFLIMP